MTVDISVIIPVYNEVENVVPLHSELVQVLSDAALCYEIIYVNDGSRDGSDVALIELAHSASNVIFVDLRRNFGQTAALTAGIDQANGKVIVLMDADMQNDPADIPAMLHKINEGFDVISGWRRNRKDNRLTRWLPSVLANRLISMVTGVRLHDYGCTLKAYRRDVLEEIKLYGEMHRFIPVFAAAAGAHITEMEVNHRPRLRGKGKYGLGRTLKVLLDLVTVKFLLSYRTTPMYLFGGLGIALMGSGMLILGVALYNKIFEGISLILTPMPQLAATLFTMGVQSIFLGLTTELLVRTYYEAQNKPIYVVRRVMRREQ